MTALANVRDILQQYEHQHLVLRTDGRDIIIATVDVVAAELCAQLDQLPDVICHEHKLLGHVAPAVVVLYIRIDHYLFHRST